MAKKKSQSFKIESSNAKPPLSVKIDDRSTGVSHNAAVSLRYLDSSHECLSKWQQKELKAFSAWVTKMCKSTEADIRKVTSNCHAHEGKQKALPSQVSPDVKMFSLRVTQKARAHGFFAEGSFYLVWLDRGHKLH